MNENSIASKITLIKLTENRETLIPPYGVLLMATELRKKGFDPSILHLERDEIDIAKIVESVSEDLLVGISTLTSNYLTVELEISEAIKREHGDKVKVVWGGHHPSLCPETTLKEDCIDYIVVGEGEEAIVSLAEFLQKGEKQNGEQKHWRNEPGIGYREGNKNIINPKALLPDLEPHAYAWDLIDVEKYLNPEFGYKRVLSYISSKGCPYTCTFCYNVEFNNRRWRGWSSEKVVKDINYLKEKYDVEAIYFYDDYYFTHKKRVREIAEGIDLPWYGELRANDIKNDKIREYKKLNAFGFFFGAESGSENVLEITSKKIKPTDILDAARICKEEGISHLRCSFIFFVPGEIKKDILVTVALITKLMREYPYVGIGIGNYTPYPGVPLTEKAKDFGWKEPTTTKAWAKYDRTISPYEVGIFPDSYIGKVLQLRENALRTQNFYHLLNERKTIGKLINIMVRPFSILFDHLLRLNIVSHTFESLLMKLFYPPIKLFMRFISFFFKNTQYLRKKTSETLEQTTPHLKTGPSKRKYF